MAGQAMFPGIFSGDVRMRWNQKFAKKFPELAVQGVMMRKYGQEIIKITAGKKIHGTGAIPGGVNKNVSVQERDFLLKDLEQMLKWFHTIHGLHRPAQQLVHRLADLQVAPQADHLHVGMLANVDIQGSSPVLKRATPHSKRLSRGGAR